MVTGTVALPTLHNVRLRQAVRIAVGIKREGKKAPEKLDHFVLTRWNPQAKSYVIDREAMQALGDPKPTRLPILVMANLVTVPDAVTGEPRLEVPESVMRTRMAYYWGSRAQCVSAGFGIKDQERCAKDGIEYPPDPNHISAWIGEARRRRYDDNGRMTAEKCGRCNPYKCPFATGQHDLGGTYASKPLCKPQTIFTCMLPFMPRLGVAAKFVTTSWQSTALLRSSLLQIGALNQGWLAMLPLELVVSIERVSSEGYTAPVVNVEFAGNQLQLARTTAEVKAQLVGYERQIAALDDGNDLLALESGELAGAYAREFAHETAEERPDTAPGIASMTDGYLGELAEEAGWTEARMAAELASAGDDEDEVIATLERETGRAVQDADWEDPDEAEALPDDEALDEGVALEPPPLPDDGLAELFPDAPEVNAARAARKPKRLVEEGQ